MSREEVERRYKRDRAAYMRAYRARRRAEDVEDVAALEAASTADWRNAKPLAQVEAELRVEELEEEVRHLKAELAKRSNPTTAYYDTLKKRAFNTRPFTPVPKK